MMWALLLAWWQRSYGTVLKWGGIAAAMLLGWFNVRQSGRTAARIEQLIAEPKQMEEAHAVENDMRQLNDGADIGELRREWQRKQ